ncbi:MAG: hypothetical protein R3E87_12330 [Burkholderiaceae bacterium]
MSLQLHPDFDGTFSVVRGDDGRLRTEGKPSACFGYGVDSKQGTWVRWHWQGDTLTVENDRFGFLPLYYAADRDGIRVATSIQELLALGVDRGLDDEALAVFLRLGQYLGEDTPFKAIRSLAPGTRLTWRDGRLSLARHSTVLPEGSVSISREQAVRRYGELMQIAVERMIPTPETRMCVPLSAGRDSRHILYALVRAGRAPDDVITARSMAPRPDNDVRIASQITAALGLRHTIIEQSEDRYGDEREKNLLTGYFADEHVQMMPVVRWLQSNRIDVSWDGIAGDIFSCGVYDKEEFITGFRDPAMRAVVDSELGDEGYLELMLRPQALARWPRAMAEERLRRELANYRDLPNPIAPYFFLNRVRRKLALSPFGMLDRGTHVLAPYLDHDLFDTLIGLPLSYFRGRLFHSEAIDAFYPELPRFPYVSVHEGFVPERRDRIWRFAYRLGREALEVAGADTAPSVTRRSLLARLTKAALSTDYGTRMPILFSRLVVLLQLESELAGGARP